MKPRLMLKLSILLISFGLIIAIPILRAQSGSDAISSNELKQLPGNSTKVEEMVSKCDGVFIGEFKELGSEEYSPQLERPSIGSNYHGVVVKVLQSLRGTFDSRLSVTMFVGIAIREHIFKVSSTCIFFVKKNAQGAPDPYTVLKLLPATDDNVAKVKALIAAAPAGK